MKLVPLGILAAAALLAPASAGADVHVLDVGDSHTWLTQGCCPYGPAWEVDAVPGRNSTEALAVLRSRLRGRHDEVVFDLATNDAQDPASLRRNLNAVWHAIGPA